MRLHSWARARENGGRMPAMPDAVADWAQGLQKVNIEIEARVE